MRLAIPYDNGQVFQHFGRSEQFKIYEVADGAIESTHVLENNGEGHGARHGEPGGGYLGHLDGQGEA